MKTSAERLDFVFVNDIRLEVIAVVCETMKISTHFAFVHVAKAVESDVDNGCAVVE